MIAYKYLSQEHLALFRNKGTVKVNTLFNLRTEAEKIKDPLEGSNEVSLGSETEDLTFYGKKLEDILPTKVRVLDDKTKICLKKGVYFKDSNIIENAYIFCMSLKRDNRIATNLGYNANYRIVDVEAFANTIYNKLNEVSTIKGYVIDKVKYENKRIVATTVQEITSIRKRTALELCLSKSLEFSSDQELRIVFVPQFQQEIIPQIIDCPKAKAYCDF